MQCRREAEAGAATERYATQRMRDITICTSFNGTCHIPLQYCTVSKQYMSPNISVTEKNVTQYIVFKTVQHKQSCSAFPVVSFLSACPVLSFLFCLSHSVFLSQSVFLSRSVFPVLPIPFCLSRSVFPVLPVPFCLSCSACPILSSCPVLSFLFCLSRSAYPVLSFLFCLSPTVFPVMPVPFCLSFSACPFCLSCSAWPVLSLLL